MEPPRKRGIFIAMMDPTPASAQLVGRYAIFDAIATGGMATIHLGRLVGPMGFSRTVAIKRLHAQFARDPEFVAMFSDEARLAARIHHPNVVQTLDVVATEGELFLVMEYVKGESLSKLIKLSAEKRIDPDLVVAIVSALLHGLHAAHEALDESGVPLGLVHRDVSPQNVLVGLDGVSRVLDFGVAKAENRMSSTREGQLKGKLLYMSPEQLEGENVDRKTDIYAAAIVLFEALTNQRMFSGKSEGAQIAKITRGEITLPSAIDPGLAVFDPIVKKGAAHDPNARYATAKEMAAALEACCAPASAARVGSWVETIAGASIDARARRAAALEQLPNQDEIRHSIHSLSEDASKVVPSQSSGVEISSSVEPRKRSRWPWALPLLLLFAAGVVFVIAPWKTRAVSTTPSFSEQPQPPPPASTPAPAPTPSATVVDVPVSAPRPTMTSVRAAPSKKTTKPDCEQPYVVDSVGHMHFRKECL